MKQLINRYDNKVQLIGIEEAQEEAKGESATAQGERAHLYTYIRFVMPTRIGGMVCVWSGEDWLLADMEEKKEVPHESEEFRAWLRERLKKKGYTAKGVSVACGLSKGWLSNILEGRRRLKDKQTALLERELGLAPGTLKKWRR